MFRQPLLRSAIALAALLAINSADAAQRVFVASYGNDSNTANNCSFLNPCRGFTAAMTVVDSGGEVVALDAAGYGVVTITKSVTITANPGFYAGISAGTSTSNAVTIAAAGLEVILRGLNINSTGAGYGVYMANASVLTIENCVVSNFTNSGVQVDAGATLRVVDSVIRGNAAGIFALNGSKVVVSGTKFHGNSGVAVNLATNVAGLTTTGAISNSFMANNNAGVQTFAQGNSAAVRVSVTGSTLSNNNYGVLAVAFSPATAVLTLGTSTVTGSATAGLYQDGDAATFESLGNNTVRQNGATVGTITPVSPM